MAIDGPPAKPRPTAGRPYARWMLLLTAILAVPVLPFLLFGSWFQSWGARLAEQPPTPPVLIGITIALLSSDIFLPVPSSVVSTLAGAKLAGTAAVLASWLGMNVGAGIGFAAARTWGRALAERYAKPADLEQLDRLPAAYGPWFLLATRSLPVLAEATVLLWGVRRLAWRRFWPPILLSNLGIAVGYTYLGRTAADQAWLPAALGISAALPLTITWLLQRHWLPRADRNGAP